MLRYLPGILLLQCATVLIIWFIPRPVTIEVGFGITLAIILLGTFVSLWFASLSKSTTQEAVNKVNLEFAKEREKYQVRAERAKTRLVEKTQKQIASEVSKTQGKANLKVGGAVAAAVGAGVLMIVIELLTFGLMTLTTAAGAMGGYAYRAKKAHKELSDHSPPVIDIIENNKRLPKTKVIKKTDTPTLAKK